jgi:hypothetical protein
VENFNTKISFFKFQFFYYGKIWEKAQTMTNWCQRYKTFFLVTDPEPK